jgi:hypothetical protein
VQALGWPVRLQPVTVLPVKVLPVKVLPVKVRMKPSSQVPQASVQTRWVLLPQKPQSCRLPDLL